MPPSSHASDFDSESPRFSDASISGSDWPAEPRLRGLRWRVLLGILPHCPAPIESLRQAAANGRRRYAEMRRRLIVDPHALEDVQRGENLSVNNPLSQDPDSIWGRYFRNAELEKIIESDLTRLYPERGSFFQSVLCQAMLRRILLVWALTYPQYGYRQGMHEVLAPLIYVLHMDVTHLSQVRQRYEDPFEDRFDTPFSTEGRHGAPSFSSRSSLRLSSETMLNGDRDWIERVHPEDLALVEPDDFGFNLKTMVLGSDSYGAEGELGALLSSRYVEHDGYCMFDSLMRGQGGAVALAEYFTVGNEGGRGLSPVLEASTDIYHSLAVVDMPLYIHLVGLGVEPQFFALRWLRVLFGREFELEKLLPLWDAIFAASNSMASLGEGADGCGCGSSARGAFITSFAVSMILYLRSTLLAASNATTCLQKLLNFPKNVDIRNLIEDAKMLQAQSGEFFKVTPPPGARYPWMSLLERNKGSWHKSMSRSPSFQQQARVFSLRKTVPPRHPGSPEMSRRLPPPESYWEERWISSILPEEEPSTVPGVDTTTEDLQSSTVAKSISVPEELLVGRASQDEVTNFSHLDSSLSADCATIETLEGGAFATGSNDGASSKEEVHDAEGHFQGSKDGTSRDFREDNNVHVCIRALDLNAGRSFNELSVQNPEAAQCSCSLCNNGFEGELQQGCRRRHSVGELPVSKSRTMDEGATFIDHSTSDVSNKKCSRAALHTLGRSMADNLQVLENAVSSMCRREGPPTTFREGDTDATQQCLLDAKEHFITVAALTDLRRISNALLQM